MTALAEQKKETLRARREEQLKQANLEKMMVENNMEKDRRLIAEEQEKNLKRRKQGQ